MPIRLHISLVIIIIIIITRRTQSTVYRQSDETMYLSKIAIFSETTRTLDDVHIKITSQCSAQVN